MWCAAILRSCVRQGRLSELSAACTVVPTQRHQHRERAGDRDRDGASQLGDRSLSKAMIGPRFQLAHSQNSQSQIQIQMQRYRYSEAEPAQPRQQSTAKRGKPFFIPPTVGRRVESQKNATGRKLSSNKLQNRIRIRVPVPSPGSRVPREI